LKEIIKKANVLLEALPYIKKFYGCIFVFKYGGKAMTDGRLKTSFARDILMLHYIGIKPVIVHGGGPEIDAYLKKMGKVPRFVNGQRVTDDETMEIVEMVLAGKINKNVVSLINSQGGRAIGLCGKDSMLFIAEKLKSRDKLGRVGRIKRINSSIIIDLLKDGFIPVIAPVSGDEKGKSFNINADYVASEIASNLKAEKLVFLSDIEGVIGRDGKKIDSISLKGYKSILSDISGGMLPKIESAFDAVKNGVKKVHIVDGRIEHAILLEIFTDRGIGTEIKR